ncbi:hypothetical protein C8R44DRAFT_818919 [Mycena epipterygia]|nr:hypothetical protein C8R44DRAFT_818919 [Mycena epipterygia]
MEVLHALAALLPCAITTLLCIGGAVILLRLYHHLLHSLAASVPILLPPVRPHPHPSLPAPSSPFFLCVSPRDVPMPPQLQMIVSIPSL